MSSRQRPQRPAPAVDPRVPGGLLPLQGVLVGLAAGGIYWLAALVWPSSVAVAMSLLAARLAGRATGTPWRDSPPSWINILVLLTQYNALMALTAANLPFPLRANAALGLIMVCGSAAGHGLRMSLPATAQVPAVSHVEVGMAMGAGFAPALLLGIPGLAGLGAALGVRLASGLFVFRGEAGAPPADTVQQIAEAAFYLGALATWKYV